jgi:hypothetical protein
MRTGGCDGTHPPLLHELSGKFRDRFPVSPDTYEVLDLIETLWTDPHVDQVPDMGLIWFAWNEQGFDQVLDTGLVGGNPLPVRRNMASARLKASRRRQQAAAMGGDADAG